MFKKGTKLYSITSNKCPRSHEGQFFKHRFIYIPNKIILLPKNCPNCKLKYLIDSSFFYGAMYVGYGLTVAISVTMFLIASLIFNTTLLESFIVILITLIILMPLIARLSRVFWINLFIEFEEKFTQKKMTF